MAFGLPPASVGVRFHRKPMKTWRDRLRRLYPATTPRRPIHSRGVVTYFAIVAGRFYRHLTK